MPVRKLPGGRGAALGIARCRQHADGLRRYAATPCAEYRKDRVRIVSGPEYLAEFRLQPGSASRRVIATCCNTPMFLEMKGAHWLSLYLHLWPAEVRPKAELRTMTGDLPDVSGLPQDIPNLRTHSVSFYARLLAAWIAMGFRNPKFDVGRTVDA